MGTVLGVSDCDIPGPGCLRSGQPWAAGAARTRRRARPQTIAPDTCEEALMTDDPLGQLSTRRCRVALLAVVSRTGSGGRREGATRKRCRINRPSLLGRAESHVEGRESPIPLPPRLGVCPASFSPGASCSTAVASQAPRVVLPPRQLTLEILSAVTANLLQFANRPIFSFEVLEGWLCFLRGKRPPSMSDGGRAG